MAATRFLGLSIFLLITAAATTTANVPHVQCCPGNGGGLAVLMKQGVVVNLMYNLPYLPVRYYCYPLTFKGQTMYGYAQCPLRDSHGDASMRACMDCLLLVGPELVKSCDDSSAGYAWDEDSVCFLNVGYSLDVVCLKGSY